MPTGIPAIIIFIYRKCIHINVSTKSVYSIRIDPRIRKMMEEMGETDWQEKIRQLIEDSVRKERRQHLLARAKQAHRDQPAGPPAASLIRGDRDAR
jgi:uncharacterized protein YneF (UPF0154 family)